MDDIVDLSEMSPMGCRVNYKTFMKGIIAYAKGKKSGNPKFPEAFFYDTADAFHVDFPGEIYPFMGPPEGMFDPMSTIQEQTVYLTRQTRYETETIDRLDVKTIFLKKTGC